MKKLFNIILFLFLFSGNIMAYYNYENTNEILMIQMQSTSALYTSEHYNNLTLDNNGIAQYPYNGTINSVSTIKKSRGLDIDPDDVPIGYLPIGDPIIPLLSFICIYALYMLTK
jgi:hypothetical protein